MPCYPVCGVVRVPFQGADFRLRAESAVELTACSRFAWSSVDQRAFHSSRDRQLAGLVVESLCNFLS
jgi:hypothetical protein